MAENPMTEAARELRRRQTEAEKRLRFKLRDNQACGVKFRRQESIGKYIVDFVNYENKLVIEIDGSSHQKDDAKRNDRQKTKWLESEGFRVIRFWNSSVEKSFDGVISIIKGEIRRPVHPHLTSPIEVEE